MTLKQAQEKARRSSTLIVVSGEPMLAFDGDDLDEVIKQVYEDVVQEVESMRKTGSPLHDAHQFYQVKDYNQAIDDLLNKLKNES